MRIFHLDCGRKYFSVDEIKGIIDQLSANHYTHLQLAFGNDGFRFLLDDMKVGSNESDVVKTAIQNANISYSNDMNTASTVLSQTDMDTITAYAKAKGIEIIPLLNTPGHMTVLLDAMEELDSSIKSEMNVNQGSGTYFDPQTCTAAAELTKELVGKYAKYFADKGSKYFNLGADECGFDSMTKDNGKYVGFVNYINDLNAIVKSNGMTSLAFNDGFYRTDLSTSAKIDTDVLVCYWSASGSRASTEALSEAGYKIINTNDSWYYVLGDYLNEIWASPQWYYAGAKKALQTIPVTQVKDNSSVTPIGSMLCLWCDGPHKDYSESKDNVYDLIKTMADSNPDYFKEADAPEQTLTDSATGITVTLTPSGGAAEYVYSIEIKISVEFTSKRTAKVTVSVNITENGLPYTNGATLKIPYETWDSYLAESGFGIDEVIELAANVSGDSVEVTRDDKNRNLILTVPHFSDVEIDATIADDSEAVLNKKDIILDINGTATEVVSGVNLAGNYEPNPTGIATVTVTGKDEIAGTTKTEVDYTEAKNVYCGSLIDSDSDTWKKASQELYYKAGDGKYYPLYVKRSSYTSDVFNQRKYYTYTWGYSKTDSSNNVQEINTHQVLQRSANTTKINITVYTKTEKTITTDPTPASTNIVFTGVKAGTTKVTIGNTEYTIKVRKAPVDVTVNCVCDGKVLGTTTVEAKDDFNGGYYYSMTAPSVSGYKYTSGKLSGTVTGADTVTLTYEKIVLDLGDTITIPISIIDYRADGLLFDWTFNPKSGYGDSYRYGLVHSDATDWGIAVGTGVSAALDTNTGLYYVSGTATGVESIPGTIIERTGSANNSTKFYPHGTDNDWSRAGLVEAKLGVNGMPVYTDAAVQYVAGLLKKGYYNKITQNGNSIIYDTFVDSNGERTIRNTSATSFSPAFKAAQTYENIKTAYDLAWYLLNTFYISDTNMTAVTGTDGKNHDIPIYGMAVNAYDKIILKKDGTSYKFDASNNDVLYDTANRAIYEDSSVTSKAFYPINNLGYEQPGLLTGTSQNTTENNGNFTLRGEAQFIYNEADNLYFTFKGDDDVYMFINGVLALDLGGAHGSNTKTVKLNDLDAATYNLVDGQPATFTFFYMERCSDNSTFAIETNLKLAEPEMQVEKNAYAENGNKLVPSGSAVPSYSDVIYDFVVRNTGNTDMTNLVLTDTDGFSNRAVFGENSKATGNGKAKFDFTGPFTVWFEGKESEAKTFTTYDEATAYVATVTLAPGESLHVKGLRGKFTPGTNLVFTYENTLNVTAKAGDSTLKGSANHKLYSFDIGDTSMAYVVDFGLPMTISRLFDASVDATKYVKSVALATTGKYGTIRLINAAAAGDTGLEYILTSPISGAEIIELDITLDIEGTSITTHKYVTIIPATTVYYEDNFDGFITFDGVSCEWTTDGTEIKDRYQNADSIGDVASNVYGYDDAYKDMSKFSLGSAHKVTVSGDKYATASFSFYGTGFDVISATTNTSGTIVVSVTGENGYSKNYLVDTYYGYKYVNGEWKVVADAAKALWQIPVMKVANLDYGKYDVTITVAYADFFSHGQNGGGSYDFWLDAVRIYDPAGAVAGAAGGSQENYENAYKTDGECWPTYMELRDMIIRDKSFAVDSAANGMIFIDGQTGNVSMADYTSYGPNNELYLANGQAVAFRLKASGDVADIQIALKAIQESKAAHAVITTTDGKVLFDGDIATATDMYHSILDANNKIVVITNTGDGILSITNLKVTYSEMPGATDTLSLTMDEKSALAALSAVDEVLNPKTPFEPGKVDVRVEDKDITVITSPDVDGIEIDGEKVTDFTVDSETGNRIWKKPIDRILKDNPEISVVARDSNGNVSAPVTAPVVSGGSIGSLFGGFIGRLIKNILSVLFG